MKVLVLGAGVVGMATAWYLWRDGHEVTVVERHAGPADETSFGNAGGLCPSFAGPWAAPGMVGKVMRMLLQADAPIRFRPQASLHQWRWIARWVGECNAERYRLNKLRMQRVAHYSLACLRSLAQEANLHDFDFHADGTLWLFRTPQEAELGRLATRALDDFEVPWRWLEPDEVDAREPALARRTAAIAGALLLPADASGDSHRFSQALAQRLSARGVDFRFNTTVHALETEGDRVSGVRSSAGRLQADAYVVALGNQAPFLLRPLGMNLPVYPLKGYSLTVDVSDAPGAAPRVNVTDAARKVVFARLGQRLRVAGMAELVGENTHIPADRIDSLVASARALFPHASDYQDVRPWAGLRPATPTGLPMIGRLRGGPHNAWFNVGHGALGFTLAFGSAQRLSAQLREHHAPRLRRSAGPAAPAACSA